MAIFRQYIAPLLVVLIFLLSLIAVSARIFLPQDMAAPAPIETSIETSGATSGETLDKTPDDTAQASDRTAVANLPNFADAPKLERLVKGLPPIDAVPAPQT